MNQDQGIASRIRFVLHEGSLSLVPADAAYDERDAPLSVLARISFRELQGKFDRALRKDAFEVRLSLHTVLMEDLSRGLDRPANLIAPKVPELSAPRPTFVRRLSSAQWGSVIQDDPTTLPLFMLTLERSPRDVLADLKFRLVSQPLEATYLPKELARIGEFFRSPAPMQTETENIIDLSSTSATDVAAARRHLVLDAHLEVAAPLV